MSKQSRLLTVAVLSVVIAAFLWWGYMAPAGTYFELYDRERKEQLLITPVKAGDELRLEIEHSAEFIPWFEYYTVLSDGSFNLHSIAVAGYGAGIPAEMDVSHRIEDGLVWMEGINSVFPIRIMACYHLDFLDFCAFGRDYLYISHRFVIELIKLVVTAG